MSKRKKREDRGIAVWLGKDQISMMRNFTTKEWGFFAMDLIPFLTKKALEFVFSDKSLIQVRKQFKEFLRFESVESRS